MVTAEAFLNILWVGGCVGIMHDAARKFSTPLVSRESLLRVGMHLFRSWRTAETLLVCMLFLLSFNNYFRGPSLQGATAGLQRTTTAAICLSQMSGYVFPMPYLLTGGDYTNECLAAEVERDDAKFPLLPIAHKVVMLFEILKLSLLLVGANCADGSSRIECEQTTWAESGVAVLFCFVCLGSFCILALRERRHTSELALSEFASDGDSVTSSQGAD